MQTRKQARIAGIGLIVASLGMPATQAWNLEHSDFDLIALALASAQRAHARGEWGAVKSWAGLAVATAERDRGTKHVTSGRDLGNAAQLLDVLHLYERFAWGLVPERDVQVDSIVAALVEIDHLNCHPVWWSQAGIDYDPGTRLVRRIDGQPVDYDTWTRQIVRFGDIEVAYDPWTRMPRRIGPIEVAYDAFDVYPRAIAGAEIR